MDMELRAVVNDTLGWKHLYTSSEKDEIRGLVEYTSSRGTEVREWLIRGIATDPPASFPREQDQHEPDDGLWAMEGLERQLDGVLRLPSAKHRNAGSQRKLLPKIPATTSVLEALYADIPRYVEGEDSAATIANRMARGRAKAHSPYLSTLRGVMETSRGVRVAVFDYEKHSLQDVLKFNRHLLDDECSPDPSVADTKKRFVVYQLWQLLAFLHERNLTYNALAPHTVLLTGNLLVRLGSVPLLNGVSPVDKPVLHRSVEDATRKSPTERWCEGDLSNFEYLMILNIAAGRRMVDGLFHPVMPWVTDFSERNGGWRDLTKSKFRLNKGDQQLDLTYANSVVPHHITESLSEITYYIYMARRTPMSILRSIVRSNYQAKEYPSTMERMYTWTPDECIPEFYSDPSAFLSIHDDGVMEDLKMPDWCHDVYDFVQTHRAMLESPEVSRQLHVWIDLNFGVCLSGEEAIAQKNVPLRAEHTAERTRKSPGFVQLFDRAHPKRLDIVTVHDDEVRPSSVFDISKFRSAKPSSSADSRKHAENMLRSAVQIVNAACEATVTNGSGDSGGSNLTTSFPSVSTPENRGLSLSRVKQKKTKNPFKMTDSAASSPPAPKDLTPSRSPTIPRFTKAIPKLFGGESFTGTHFHHNLGKSTPPALTAGDLGSASPPGPSALGEGIQHGNSSSFTAVSGAAAGRAHGHGHQSSALTNMGQHGASGPHIFREFWHQLSKQEDEDVDITESSGASDFDWSDTDFEYLDDVSLQLLSMSLPIKLPSLTQDPSLAAELATPSSRVAYGNRLADAIYAVPVEHVSEGSPILSTLESRIASDVFALGCIIAELYTYQPLFTSQSVVSYFEAYQGVQHATSTHDSTSTGDSDILPEPCVRFVLASLQKLPPILKTTVMHLIHPNPVHRIIMFEKLGTPFVQSTIRRSRKLNTIELDIQSYFAPEVSMFLDSFQLIVEFITELEAALTWNDSFAVARKRIDALATLPSAMFAVCLPVLTKFFKADSHTEAVCVDHVAAAIIHLLPAIVDRVGMANATQQLLCDVIRVYEYPGVPFVVKLSLSSPEALKLLHRAFGVSAVLQHFVPVLMEWLTAQDAVVSDDPNSKRTTPLFASESATMVAAALSELSSSDVLGPSIATKYILPALLHNLGKSKSRWTKLAERRKLIRKDSYPSSSSGLRPALGGRNGDGIHVAFVSKKSLSQVHQVGDALLAVCRELPETTLCSVVVPHVFEALTRLVELTESISSVRIEGVPSDLAREVYVMFRVVRYLVRTLSESTVHREFLQMRYGDFVDLLNCIQPPFLHPRTVSALTANDPPGLRRLQTTPVEREKRVIADRIRWLKQQEIRAFVAVGLAKCVGNMFNKVGSQAIGTAAGGLIMQSVNAFLVRCAAIYSELEVSDFQWRMATEVVSEFCVPFRNQLGEDGFALQFPSVPASSVLQLLLLPSYSDRTSRGSIGEFTSFRSRQPVDRSDSDADTNAEQLQKEVEVLMSLTPTLLAHAYRVTRIHGIKMTSWLHLPGRLTAAYASPDELNEEIFLLQEEKKRRKVTNSAPRTGSSDNAWLRPRVSKLFESRRVDPDSIAISNSDVPLGSSWAFMGEVRQVLRGHSSPIRSISVDAAEDIAITASKNGSCRVWRLSALPAQSTSTGIVYFDSPLVSVHCMNDSKQAIATDAACVHVWDVQTSRALFNVPFRGESVNSCTLLRNAPFRSWQDDVHSTDATSSIMSSIGHGQADFAVTTRSKIFSIDMRSGPRVVADWCVDPHDHTAITTSALLVGLEVGTIGALCVGTATGQVSVFDKRTGRRLASWQALESKVIKIQQYAPTLILVVGNDREARVWDISKLDRPRTRMLIRHIPEGAREAQFAVQNHADSAVLYITATAKIYATQLVTSTDRDDVVVVRLESVSLLDNTHTPTSASTRLPSPDRAHSRLPKCKMNTHSINILPLRQVMLLGAEDGMLRAVV
ncbi:hypothetical protein Poli38472_011249 [Pythium oligandrum]|uniref:BEACH domain-containing protein n=1 Tax=Pythium oligandrum TaxID=41045 RepID=A0A8K1CQ90_PYTOL|nr:hypothetical protein Poli38472_011249 [Pythium oligandrum]|eukprot:TMW67629.1 hypothetical protein Poli38472_011249 [Pythium oligandrum]